jgi:hypothetical protein
MKAARWRVEDGRFILPSGDGMKAACHHQSRGACGGCYARLASALDEIQIHAEDAAEIVHTVHYAMMAEGKAKKRRKP